MFIIVYDSQGNQVLLEQEPSFLVLHLANYSQGLRGFATYKIATCVIAKNVAVLFTMRTRSEEVMENFLGINTQSWPSVVPIISRNK